MSDLIRVEVRTKSGGQYVMPDVSRRMLRNAIDLGAWNAHDVIVLVNVHAATLCIPKSTIETVSMDGEEAWCFPA